MDTTNQTTVTDDTLEQKITQLASKSARSDDDIRELDDLKKERSTRYQKRINQMNYEKEHAREEKEEAVKRAEDAERELEELRKNRDDKEVEPVAVIKDTTDVGGKKFFTDEALMSMVKAGEMNDNDAWKYARQRDKEEAADMAYQRIKDERKQNEDIDVRKKDSENVLSEYPQFSKGHRDFNADDPLYKEASRLYENGYKFNPEGLSQAIRDAKKILGITNASIDNSENLNVHSATVPPRGDGQAKAPSLSDEEKDAAVRIYRDQNNPLTNRPYTESEAIDKAQQAKARRSRRMT